MHRSRQTHSSIHVAPCLRTTVHDNAIVIVTTIYPHGLQHNYLIFFVWGSGGKEVTCINYTTRLVSNSSSTDSLLTAMRRAVLGTPKLLSVLKMHQPRSLGKLWRCVVRLSKTVLCIH